MEIPTCRFIKLIGIELEGGWKPERGIMPYNDYSVQNIPIPGITCRTQYLAETGRHLNGDPTPCSGCDECRQPPITRAEWINYVGGCVGTCDLSGDMLPEDPNRCDWCRRQLRVHRASIISERSNRRRINRRLLIGEICSLPETPKTAIEWMLTRYPDAINRTCGLHVHVSFGTSILRYAQLMDGEFWEFFQDRFGLWAKNNIPGDDYFWERWAGGNRYCRARFVPDEQIVEVGKNENRYTHLNYCWGFQGRDRGDGGRRGTNHSSARKTLELRLFPVFSEKELAANAICQYLSTIEEYLHEKASRRRAERVKETAFFEGDIEQVVEEEPYLRYA